MSQTVHMIFHAKSEGKNFLFIKNKKRRSNFVGFLIFVFIMGLHVVIFRQNYACINPCTTNPKNNYPQKE